LRQLLKLENQTYRKMKEKKGAAKGGEKKKRL